MSISIIDYISDCIFPEILPDSPIQLVFCEEHCLVPDSLKATLLIELDKIQILKGGLFIYRTSTNFNKGCLIGLALSIFPDSKLFTSRREIFSAIIPNMFLEFLYQPIPTPKLNPVQTQLKNTSGSFVEIYNESLTKFTKTFLLDKSLRAVKSRSLRAQAKNLVDGVIISLNRKYGRSEATDSEIVVNAMFDDFERHGVFKVCYNNVEYNDVLIEAFFGLYKSKIFIPGFDSRNGNEQIVDEASNNLRDRQGVSPNIGNSLPGFNQSSMRTPGFVPNFLSNTMRTPSFEQPTPANVIKKPEPFVNPVANPIFPVISPALPQASNMNPLIRNIPQLSIGSSSTLITRGGPEPVPNIIPANNSISDQIPNTIKKTFDWGEHENKIADEILEKVSSENDIDSILKLYKTCNRTARNYLTSNELVVDNAEIEEKVKKNMKLALQTFYECREFDVEDIVEKYKNVSNFKLVRALE